MSSPAADWPEALPFRTATANRRAPDAIFLSPHLDDAVLSCAGHLASLHARGEAAWVVSLYTEASPPPYTPFIEEFHRQWGGLGQAGYAVRQSEELEALEILGADHVWMGWLDVLYRDATLTHAKDLKSRTFNPETDVSFPSLCELLRQLQQLHPRARFYAPLGLGFHRDHVVVSRAAEVALDPARLCFYEDFPYVAYYPDQLAPRVQSLRLTARELDIGAYWDLRLRASAAYASQLEALFRTGVDEVSKAYFSRSGSGAVERLWCP